MCLVGTPGGHTVQIMCLADLFPYLTTISSLVYHNIHLASRVSLLDYILCRYSDRNI
jgi:hypothetical protein